MGGKKRDDGTFHGTFVRDRGEGVRVAGPKAVDLSSINAPEAQERLAQTLAAKVPGSFPDSVSPTKHRKTKLAVMGLSAAVLDAGDPRYAQCVRLANAYRKVRAREFYIAHGFVSSGVSALLASAAMALAGARYLYEIASATEEEGVITSRSARGDMLKKASQLSDSARQNELSAWELCSREAVIRKRNDANGQALPWVTGPTDVSGKEVRRPGRPRKAAASGVSLALAVASDTGENNAGTVIHRETESASQEGGGENQQFGDQQDPGEVGNATS